MSRGNRNLAAKFERAKRERVQYATEAQAKDDIAKARIATSIVATHWGLTVTQEERDRLVADFVARGRVKILPKAEYKRHQSGLHRY